MKESFALRRAMLRLVFLVEDARHHHHGLPNELRERIFAHFLERFIQRERIDTVVEELRNTLQSVDRPDQKFVLSKESIELQKFVLLSNTTGHNAPLPLNAETRRKRRLTISGNAAGEGIHQHMVSGFQKGGTGSRAAFLPRPKGWGRREREGICEMLFEPEAGPVEGDRAAHSDRAWLADLRCRRMPWSTSIS